MREGMTGNCAHGILKCGGRFLWAFQISSLWEVALVHLTKYHPSIRRLQEDFAARVARKENPDAAVSAFETGVLFKSDRPLPTTIDECLQISCQIRDREIRDRKEISHFPDSAGNDPPSEEVDHFSSNLYGDKNHSSAQGDHSQTT
jgi:hypothetical protein